MITIKQPTITTFNGKSRLSADIDVDGKTYPLWYEVDEEYGQYLCDERSDAFVVGLLKWALVHHHDFTCEAPVTTRLKKQIEEIFIPAVCNENKKSVKPIRIIGNTAPGIQKGVDAVGAGISCGLIRYTLFFHIKMR